MADLTDMLRHNEQPVWPGNQEVGRCFAEIGRLVESPARAVALASRLTVLVNELFVCVLEMFRDRRITRRPELATTERSVALFLEELKRSPQEPWSLDSMAAVVGIHRTRFVHYCRKLTNTTPAIYLNRLRVNRAQEAMRNDPDRSLTDIAYDCGFATSQYFATVFRNLAGCSPSDFRGRLSPGIKRTSRVV